MRTRYVVGVAALAALVALTSLGCGTRRTVAAPSRSSASSSPEGPCPPPEAAAHATPCVPDLLKRLQDSNHRFRQRIPVPQNLLTAQRPAKHRIAVALNRLTAAGRQHVDDIEAAVKASGVRAVEIDIDPTTDTRIHQFGVLVAAPQAICVFGTIGPEEVTVDLGGITMEGGCVAGPGGH